MKSQNRTRARPAQARWRRRLRACARAPERAAMTRDDPGLQPIFPMRISGGVARGITLAVPRGDAVRPATDGMRQAVFSSLAHRIPGAWFLDLFAGSGAYGLEAVSRGAAGGYFVEKNRLAAECVRKNIEAVCKSAARSTDDLHVAQRDALDFSW